MKSICLIVPNQPTESLIRKCQGYDWLTYAHPASLVGKFQYEAECEKYLFDRTKSTYRIIDKKMSGRDDEEISVSSK